QVFLTPELPVAGAVPLVGASHEEQVSGDPERHSLRYLSETLEIALDGGRIAQLGLCALLERDIKQLMFDKRVLETAEDLPGISGRFGGNALERGGDLLLHQILHEAAGKRIADHLIDGFQPAEEG